MDRRRKLGVRRTLVLLALFCLVKCTAGSCLSYGHSCWGAHGKRSNAPRSLPPDLDFLRILGRIASNTQMEENSLKRHPQIRSNFPAIYRTDFANDDEENTEKIDNVGNIKGPQAASENFKEERGNGYPAGIPMLDDDFLTQTRIWKLMKAAASNEQ